MNDGRLFVSGDNLMESLSNQRCSFRKRFSGDHPAGTLGFTLIELLTVVAIIAILSALLLPAISGVIKRADTATCISRIRAIMVAEVAYSSDNEGNMVSETLGTVSWVTFLAPYATQLAFDRNKNEWICCPASKKMDSGYKVSGIGPVLASASTHLNPVHGEWDKPPTKRANIKLPSRTPSWMDVSGGSFAGYPAYCRGCTPNGRSFSSSSQITDPNNFGDRHQGSANVGFVDGHIERVRIEVMQKTPVPGGDDFFRHYD